MNRRSILALAIISTFVFAIAAACGSSDDTTNDPAKLEYSFGLTAQVVASGADATAVRAIDFAPDGRIFYAEQFTGQIRIVNQDGTLQAAPFATLQVANWLDLDWGLTGLALDPQFATNKFVYAFYTSKVSESVGKPTIVRYTDTNGNGTDQRIISDDFPETFAGHEGYNANGEIHFGPDGFLYASLGDYDQGTADTAKGGHPELVNDLKSPIGKILRLDKADGTAAAGNPFEGIADDDARIFASGFREPFSFTFDPTSGSLYGTDNTTVSCEELNVITAGKAYGWGTMGDFPFANCAAGVGEQPIYNFAREGVQPGDFLSFVESQGISVLKGSKYTQLTDGVIICESQKSLVGTTPSNGALVRLTIAGTAVSANDIIVKDCKGAATVHDGEVYYADGTQLLKLVEAAVAGTSTQQVPPAGS
ncbi:MAG: PQQ-dependent sugar dehydrogenase [Chloroflexota bacterium]